MVIKDGKMPSARASHSWTAKFKNNPLNIFGIGNSKLRFRCGGKYHVLKIKGTHIDKKQHNIEMSHAHLMRQRDDNFFYLVDLSHHGVNKSARKTGGYMLYTFARVSKDSDKWITERYYYSKETTSQFGVEGIGIAHKWWRIVRYCYYGMAVKENTGGDNSG